MGKVTDTIRRVIGAEPATRGEPEVIDRRAQYADLMRQFIDGWRSGHGTIEQHLRLNAFRQLVHKEGHGPALEALWIDPPTTGDTALRTWFIAEMGHRLFGGPAAGPRPHQRHEWGFWRERYQAACASFLSAARSGDSHATNRASDNLVVVRNETRGAGQGGKLNHLMLRPTATDEATLAAWEREAAYVLEHGRPSGQYREPSPPPAFRRASEIAAADHSPVVLLAPHDGQSIGARIVLDADTSHALVEAGRAVWCEPARVPFDPRPPVDETPDASWIEVMFLRDTRLRSRHVRIGGEVTKLAPDEADALVSAGMCEFYVAPPPPPVLPRTVFGAV